MAHFPQHVRHPLGGQIPPRDLDNCEPWLASKLGHFEDEWIGQDFIKNFGGILENWHFWLDIISDANRELKWPIICYILGLLLRARLPPRFGLFRAGISSRIGSFWETNGSIGQDFVKFFGKVFENSHFRRDIIPDANRELNVPFSATF